MIKWFRQALAMHREWGWVAEMDESGRLIPARERRLARRLGARRGR